MTRHALGTAGTADPSVRRVTGGRGRALALGCAAAVALIAAAALPACGKSATQGPSATPVGSSATPTPAATALAFVRVNQVGYAAGMPKRAYLMTRVAMPGVGFVVRDQGGADAYSGSVGPDLGAWSPAFPHVYPLDFSTVHKAGAYTIVVHAPASANSPAFRIGSGTDVYSQALGNALKFYQTERDGPDFIPSTLRTAPAHLNDAHALTYKPPRVDADGTFKGDLTPLGKRIDASGGWWDAGDYLKFLSATSYTDALLLAGVRDFPAQMGSGSRTSDFTAEAKHGAAWLLKMWDDTTRTLYYQVGIGGGNDTTASDHDVWRLPQVDDTYGGSDPLYRYLRNRPVFRAGPAGGLISPNLAGRDAAALAEAYQVFKGSDSGFAADCLVAAEHIYALADTHPRQLQTAIPFDFYPEAEWRDDMELGATELCLAFSSFSQPFGSRPVQQQDVYLLNAVHWAHEYMKGPNDAADTLNLYDVSGLAHFELYRALQKAQTPAGFRVTQTELLRDLRKQLGKAIAQAAKDPFQFGFPWDTWDTTAHGAGLAVMASEYDQLTHSGTYAAWTSRWLADILGANAWGTSLIVGDGTTFPHCLQHQVANLRGTLDGKPPVLLGACVEGPNTDQDSGTMDGMRLGPSSDAFKQFNGHGAKWRDAVQNYPNTEPAIDLTAPSPLAFARIMAGEY